MTRAIVDIAEHSVYAPGLMRGGLVLDGGANRGRFSKDVVARFPVSACAVEANHVLADGLRQDGFRVVDCALGERDGIASFHIGTNDEASSTRVPTCPDAHLVIRERVQVPMKTLVTVLSELKVTRVACVKLDIEGAEVNVINSLGSMVLRLSPQWTVEFHDDREFGLCERSEVDGAMMTMSRAGFSTLIRNWPSRTNVLFVDRKALAIGWTRWLGLKVRYQYLALVWRKLAGLRSSHQR